MSDDWKDVAAYGAMNAPYDGDTYLIQTEQGLEFEARYVDPETPETGTDDLTVHGGYWSRIDGEEMPLRDPPVKWRPRPLQLSIRSMES